MPKHILVTGRVVIPESLKRLAEQLSLSIVTVPSPKSDFDIVKYLPNTVVYILGGPEYFSREYCEQSVILKYLIVLGTGTASFVDQGLAEKYGIQVANIPGVNAEAVAEFALAQIILSGARIQRSICGLLDGSEWYQEPRVGLQDLKVGIVGMGAIGSALSRLLIRNGVKSLCYSSNSRKLNLETELAMRSESLEKLFGDCDVVSFHVPYTDRTRFMVEKKILKLANPQISLLNFSNPRIFSPNCLFNFLKSNSNAQCYFDGYYREWEKNGGVKDDTEQLLSLYPKQFSASSHIAAQERNVTEVMMKHATLILENELYKNLSMMNQKSCIGGASL